MNALIPLILHTEFGHFHLHCICSTSSFTWNSPEYLYEMLQGNQLWFRILYMIMNIVNSQ